MQYMSGFGNEFATEAKQGALPVGQNTPQKVAYGLYAEQLSGTPFTAPRAKNKRSWLYRILPSAKHAPFQKKSANKWASSPFQQGANPNQLRWSTLDIPREPTSFLKGLTTLAGGGDSHSNTGLAVHIYAINQSMVDQYFYNADGEMLFVPEQGNLLLKTEMGHLEIKPGEIAVIPRGICFQVHVVAQTARGYICENYGLPLQLPDLGPIGANGLANPRDFLTPVATYEDKQGDFELVTKFDGQLWTAEIDHSPLNVVAWHGNYAPYKYNLDNFCTINAVSYDHLDPSIFTVLTSPTNTAGTANIDFVIFPPRWMVAEKTFRPPYFHRNIMSEFMGLIKGVYDAKEGGGFEPGGASLHNCMSAHGPDAKTFEQAENADLSPCKMQDTLAFMFESCFVMRPTEHALQSEKLQGDYYQCWQSLTHNFKP